MLFYNLFLYILFPFAILRLFSKKEFNLSELPRIKERLGKVNLENNFQEKPIWIHAVSVGEVKVASLLVKEIKKQYPDIKIFLTVSTLTGSRQLQKLYGNDLEHQYLPYDLNIFVKRFLSSIKPKCLILIETEIWPNLINNCVKQNIPIALLNGRLSEKSLKKYQRFETFFKKIFSQLSLVVSQSQKDSDNFVIAGVIPQKVFFDHSLKFSDLVSSNDSKEINKADDKKGKKIIVCASTHPKEEIFLVNAYKKLNDSNFHLVLIPRHPHRSEEVRKILEDNKVAYVKFSNVLDLSYEITLVDKMGLIESFFKIADIAFIGGTLIPHGGQNFLEAVKHGLPIYSGASTYNFSGIVEDLQRLKILNIIESESDLASAWDNFTYNSDLKNRSSDYLLSRQGSVERSIEKLLPFIKA